MRARAALAAVALAAGAVVAGAGAAEADVCKTWYSNWDVYEGSMPVRLAHIHTAHKVCVTTSGYTFRWAASTLSETNAAKTAGFVYVLDPIRPYQQSASFDGWQANGRYQVCLSYFGQVGCPPNWGTFVVRHRVVRYDASTTLKKVNDYAVGTNVWGGDFRAVRP